MARYFMLTRGMTRKCVMHGQKKITRPGSIPNYVQNIEVFFEPGKITKVDDDSLVFDHAIRDGYIIEVPAPIQKPSIDKLEFLSKKIEDKKYNVEGVDLKEEEKNTFELDVDANKEDKQLDNNVKDIIDVGKEEENELKYEMKESGYFKCLVCGKSLKSKKRMINHVEGKH